MTFDEAKALARAVIENRPRSHVQAAKLLSEFVMTLPDPQPPRANDAQAK